LKQVRADPDIVDVKPDHWFYALGPDPGRGAGLVLSRNRQLTKCFIVARSWKLRIKRGEPRLMAAVPFYVFLLRALAGARIRRSIMGKDRWAVGLIGAIAGCVGAVLAFDAIEDTRVRSQLQNVADSASLAGVLALASNQETDDAQRAATVRKILEKGRIPAPLRSYAQSEH
jgi:hypothetical protein